MSNNDRKRTTIRDLHLDRELNDAEPSNQRVMHSGRTRTKRGAATARATRPQQREIQDTYEYDERDHIAEQVQERNAKHSMRRSAAKGQPRKVLRKFKLGWWLLAAVFLIVASVVALSVVFSDTTLNIKPVISRATFDSAVFTATKQVGEAPNTDGQLAFTVLEWESNKSKLLEPNGRKEVKKKASGTITIYNNFTTKRQRLIKNTRFESSDGKVYRIRESVMVPGKSGGTPGTLAVKVYADEAGDSYNTQSGNFTLPGLKSLPNMYTKIYAKVKSPIAGGFIGNRAVVSEEAKAVASKELREQIKQAVEKSVVAKITDDSRFFKEGVYLHFNDSIESEVDGKLELTESASVQVIVFDKKQFANTIVSEVAGNPSNGYPTIKDIDKLIVRIERSGTDEFSGDTVKLVMTGDADFVWKFNETQLKQDLIGKPREALQTVLTGYSAIDEAEAIIRPFWRSTFPKNPSDFTIKILSD